MTPVLAKPVLLSKFESAGYNTIIIIIKIIIIIIIKTKIYINNSEVLKGACIHRLHKQTSFLHPRLQ